ncbi:hypothetical protein Cni_G04240 [Canna indica]|uniref:Bifunctional inhibitor/plant lipid transfer protein/seed storage helical domain-containing protein n=1 Tax=Canna indica TaxID=4628 RepID=A0AAQ3JUD2_9LILI|nr:hypothetical protein Cni_G04240 [Canna indica]
MAREVRFTFFALALVVADHARVGGSCEVDYKMLFSLCQDSIKIAGQYEPPSSDCCAEVNKAGFACICSNMPQDVDRIVSIKKVIDVCKEGKGMVEMTMDDYKEPGRTQHQP